MTDHFNTLMKNENVIWAAQRIRERVLCGKPDEGPDDLDQRIESLIVTVMKVSLSHYDEFTRREGEGYSYDEKGKPQDADFFTDCEPANPDGFNREMWKHGLKSGTSVEFLTQLYGDRPEGI
jgi:hypothetical protein